MNREMTVFFTLAILLGVLLFAGLQLEPRLARLEQPKSIESAPADVAEPSSRGASSATKERKNPFAPPIEIKQTPQPKPPKPTVDAPPPPPPPTPPPTAVQPKHIKDLSPAEIPVGFAGIFALPNQPAEAHLLAKDGSTMIVHVGDELKALDVKIVEISGNDVTVQVGDRRASLRDLLKKQATDAPVGNATGTPGTPGATNTTPPSNASDMIRKLIEGAMGGGRVDQHQLVGLMKGLTPEQLQQLMNDPQLKKLLENQTLPVDLPEPIEETKPPKPQNGNGRNRGRNEGGATNQGGERINRAEVQR